MPSGVKIDWSKYDQLIIDILPTMTCVEFCEHHTPFTSAAVISRRAKKLGVKPKKYVPTAEHKAKTGAGVQKSLAKEQIDYILANVNKKTRLQIAKDTKTSIHIVNRVAAEHGVEIKRDLELSIQTAAGKKYGHLGKAKVEEKKAQDADYAAAIAEKKSRASRDLWQNEEYRLKVRNGIRRVYDQTDLRDRLSEYNKERYRNDPSVRDILSADRPFKNSKFNDDIATVLTGHDIEYEREFELANYKFDFKIGDLLLEAHGDYWHSLPHHKKNDKAKATIVQRYYPQYQLRVIWESEFRALKGKDRLLELVGCSEVETTQINLSDLVFNDNVDRDLAYRFLVSYHYLGSTNRVKHCFGLELHGELVCLAVFGQPVRQNAGVGRVVELVRLCRYPYVSNKNMLSHFLSKCVKRLKSEVYDTLVAYADTRLHEGTIYKASNWDFVGETKPDYQYVSADNIPMHKKTLYNRAKAAGLREREYAEANGFTKTQAGTRLKYIIKL